MSIFLAEMHHAPHFIAPLYSAVVAVAPVFDFYFTPHRASALGARIVEKILRSRGIETALLDFASSRRRGTSMPLPRELSHLKPHLIPGECGSLSFFTRFQRFGPSVDICAAEILGHRPQAVFLSCWAYCYAASTLDLAREVKARDPSALVVVGGAGVSAYPEYFVRHPFVDVACTGEAEIAVPRLIDALVSGDNTIRGLPNVWWSGRGIPQAPSSVQWTQAQEVMPAFAVTRRTPDRLYLAVSLSRGCPKRCRFCSTHLTHGRGFRLAPIRRVEELLVEIGDSPDVCVNFEDDNLLCDPSYFFDVLALMQRKWRRVSFFFENGIDHEVLTPELVRRLATRGLLRFNLSLGSASPDALQDEDRNLDLGRYASIVESIADAGLPCATYFICGLAGDSRQSVVRTLTYLARLPTLVGISMFYAVPGLHGFTDRTLFDGCSPQLCAGSSAWPWTGSLDTRSLVTAFRLARFVNACKESSDSPGERQLIERMWQERRLLTLVKRSGAAAASVVPGTDPELVAAFFDALSPSTVRVGG